MEGMGEGLREDKKENESRMVSFGLDWEWFLIYPMIFVHNIFIPQ